MKISISLTILFCISSCSSSETIPQPKEIDIQNTIQKNLTEAEQARIAYQALKRRRGKDNT